MKKVEASDKEFICDLQAPCFMALDQGSMKLIRASKTQVMFRRGDNLIKQGAFASYILFMVKGLSVQYIEDDTHKNYNLNLIKPGEFIGLSSLFSKPTFEYSSKALTDCQAFLVEKQAVTQVIEENGNFGLSLIRKYSLKNIDLFDSIRTVLFKQMNGRFADALLYIDTFKEEFPNVFQLMNRKEIADFAGISTESAVKLLKSLEKEGNISLNGKDITVLKQDKLREISKRG